MSKINIALIQQKYHQSKDKTIEVTISKIKQAVENNSELIILQELHQNEYFCQSEDIKYFDYANNYQDDLKFWSNIAKENNIVLVTSLFEKRASGLYHNTAIVFEKRWYYCW